VPDDTEILHFGSLASWTSPGAERIRAYVADLRGRAATLISYDPNVRPLLLRDPLPSQGLIEACIGEAHLVKASTEDIDWLYPDVDHEEVVSRWLDLGADVVVLTDGAEGARARTASGEAIARPGLRVEVADTVGAGDSFTSGLLASLLGRGVRSGAALSDLGGGELAGALDDAVLASALTCRRAGADPPTLAEVGRGLDGSAQ
jgi:fructokinase